MFGISRLQLGIYAGIAAVLLLVGLNSIREQSPEPGGAGYRSAGDAAPAGAGEEVPGANSGFELKAGDSAVIVDVSGGVERPGVYRLTEGDRVIDAIERAGGTVGQAVPGAINRAARLADGQQVVVPVRAGTGAPGGTAVASAGGAATSGPVSLGTATAAQLEEIDGIGPVTAGNILEFRDSKGGIGSIEELDQVSGIGPVTMEALRAALQP
ncbi:MAG: ComEA family DNA-binding protein [Solirubrobacterales bacterium]